MRCIMCIQHSTPCGDSECVNFHVHPECSSLYVQPLRQPNLYAIIVDFVMNIMIVHRKSVGSTKNVWLSICRCVVYHLFRSIPILIISYTIHKPSTHGMANTISNISMFIYLLF